MIVDSCIPSALNMLRTLQMFYNFPWSSQATMISRISIPSNQNHSIIRLDVPLHILTETASLSCTPVQLHASQRTIVDSWFNILQSYFVWCA